jgi:hypothetical protein
VDVLLEAAVEHVLQETRHGVVVLRRHDHDRVGPGHAARERGISRALAAVVQIVLQIGDIDQLATDAVALL